MEKVKIEINNCYGISCLEKEFTFTEKHSTHVVYAPNGVMKTSFANVLNDYSLGQESRDLIYKSRISTRKITDVNGDEIEKESIFVIRPLESTFKSNKVSTLLVNDDLRKRYANIHENIDIEKEKFLKELRKISGIRNNIENELEESFKDDQKPFLLLLESISELVLDESTPEYSQIIYKKIFDEKVMAFLETGDFKNQIKKYIEKYNELINESTFLKRDFNHYNASTVHKNLNENGFFKAEHSININVKGLKTEVQNEKELLEMINGEKEKILNDVSMKKIFEDIDKKISTAQLREFRDYLFANKEILSELTDVKKFRKKVWISYIKSNTMFYQSLLNESRKGQEEIKEIIEKAKIEKTDWENVIEIFNRRFYVPYNLKIKNKEDAILKDEVPFIDYCYKDNEGNIEDVNSEVLLKVLSQGEKRALYLLNIIFEIESRKKMGIETLFIIDDIADSFDYKNKYAIIEYLKEISDVNIFYSIILTHNFDFFRTVQDRVIGGGSYTNSYMAQKDLNKISLTNIDYKHIKDPFKNWKSNLDDNAKLIASISFARNIAEHIGDTENMNKLTSLLHMKQVTTSLTVRNLEDIYKTIFKDMHLLKLENPSKKVIDLIVEVSENLYRSETEVGLNLENKIVLSIAIRLNAEIFMIKKINDDSFVARIDSYQTAKLFKKYCKLFSSDEKSIEVLEKVNLMTPENIHLNSFMFEPILDISEFHLKLLYQEIQSLIAEFEINETILQASVSNNEI